MPNKIPAHQNVPGYPIKCRFKKRYPKNIFSKRNMPVRTLTNYISNLIRGGSGNDSLGDHVIAALPVGNVLSPVED